MITRAIAIASTAALLILIAAWSNATPQSPCPSGPKSLADLQQEWRDVHRMWND